jgi:hypothetical protein
MNYCYLLFSCWCFFTSHSAFSSASFAIPQEYYEKILDLRFRVGGETLEHRQWNNIDWLNRAYCIAVNCMTLEGWLGLPQHEDASIANSCRYELENRSAFNIRERTEQANEMFATFTENNDDVCAQILSKIEDPLKSADIPLQ